MTNQLAPAADQKISAEDLDLDYTRALRRTFVDKLVAEGKVTDDPDKFTMFKELLNGLDKAALGRKKIKSDEKIADKEAEAAAMIATLLNRPDIKTFGIIDGVTREVIPMLPEPEFEIEILPGEMDISPVLEDFHTFNARMLAEGKTKTKSPLS
jgi:hypothetical protein